MRINSISTQKLPGTVNWAVSESFFLLIRIFLICRFALHPAGAAPLRACRRGIALFIFAEHLFVQPLACRRRREASFCCFLQCRGHRVAYALHREDRFIGGDRAANASQRELRRDKSAATPAALRWMQGISTRPATGSHTRPNTLPREMDTASPSISGRAAAQFHKSRRSHGCGTAALGLTAALRARNARIVCNHHTNR